MKISNFIPAISYSFRGDYRYFYYLKLLQNLKYPKSKIVDIQNQKLKKIIGHAFSSVPFYRDLSKKHHLTIDDFQDRFSLKKLPIITKKDLKEDLDKFRSFHYQNLTRVTSGGSTGETSVVLKSNYFISMNRAASLRNFTICNWFPEDRSVWIWGAPYEHQHLRASFVSRLGASINKRLILNAYDYSPAEFHQWVKAINDFRPVVMYGYSSILLEFAQWCQKESIKFDSLKSVVSTSEKLINRETIRDAFGCTVYNQYGCREILSVATECKFGNMHISDDTVIVESEDDKTLLITALDSFGFPLIRYKLGDTGTLLNTTCPCGLNLSLMNIDIGRITDNFIQSNMHKVSGSAFSTYISTLDINFISYQLIQKSINEFEVRYIPNSKFSEIDKIKFMKALKEYFHSSNAIFIPIKEIPREASGKRLLYKCLVK